MSFMDRDGMNRRQCSLKSVHPDSPEYAKTMATIAQARAQGLRVEEDSSPPTVRMPPN
jgi:hypothetical protein